MRTEAPRSPLRWLAAPAALLYGLLIVYGSLYPFRFQGLPSAGRVLADLLEGAEQVSTPDVVLNLLAYAPLGLLLGLLGGGRPARVCWVALGAALSLALETLQAMQAYRVASLLDSGLNVSGLLAGVWLGPRLRRLLGPGERHSGPGGSAWLPRGPALAALALFVLAAAAPFVPSLRIEQLHGSLVPLTEWWQGRRGLDPAAIVFHAAGTLTLGFLLRWATPGARCAGLWFAAGLVTADLAQLLMVTRTLSPELLIGQATAFAGVLALRNGPVARLCPLSAALLAGAVVATELTMSWQSTPAPINWLPFRPHVMQPLIGIQDVLATAWPLFAVGLCLGTGRSPGRAIKAIALVLGCGLLEWAQRYATGGFPDVTDALVAAVAGLAGIAGAWRAAPPITAAPPADAPPTAAAGAAPAAGSPAHTPPGHG